MDRQTNVLVEIFMYLPSATHFSALKLNPSAHSHILVVALQTSLLSVSQSSVSVHPKEGKKNNLKIFTIRTRQSNPKNMNS